MKKLFTLLSIILLATNVFAGWKNTMLRIREERGRSISASIDGRRYNKINRTLTIGDLPAGEHFIKVFAYNSNGYGYRNGTLIYQGNITTQPGKIYYCNVYDKGIDIEENCCIDNYGNWNNNDNWDMWNESNHSWNNNHQWQNHRDHTESDDRDYNNSWNNTNDNDHWNNNSNHHSDNNHNYYNDNNWNSYNGLMSTGQYNLLIDQIRKASFESSKTSVANTALSSNKITVEQLIGIVKEFAFESTKLDFIKSNYKKVIDKKNIFLVNDVFVFQSSKDELSEFVNQQTR